MLNGLFSNQASMMLLLMLIIFHQVSGVPMNIKFRIFEHPESNYVVGNLYSTLNKSPTSTRLRLESMSNDDSDLTNAFRFDKNSGNLYTSNNPHVRDILDREKICPDLSDTEDCFIELIFSLDDSYPVFVRVVIEDINDNLPIFPNGPAEEVSVPESVSDYTLVSYPLEPAIDPDSKSSRLLYYLSSEQGDIPFKLKSSVPDPVLLLTRPLDFEEQSKYQLNLKACDGSKSESSCTVKTVTVHVQNANDAKPKFANLATFNDGYHVQVQETKEIGQVLLQVQASDADAGDFGRIRYSLSAVAGDASVLHYFLVEPETGLIRIKKKLPASQTLIFKVVAEDAFYSNFTPIVDCVRFSEEAKVTVTVMDANNHKPVIIVQNNDLFKEDYACIEGNNSGSLTRNGIVLLPENTQVPKPIAYLTVIDKDSGVNARVDCHISHTHFQIQFANKISEQQSVYKLIANTTLDAELLKQFPDLEPAGSLAMKGITGFIKVPLTCSDMGVPKQTTKQEIRVAVIDRDEHIKYFNDLFPSELSVPEDTALGKQLLRFSVNDFDSASYTVFELIDEQPENKMFRIDASSGALFLQNHLDYEKSKLHNVSVRAREFRNLNPAMDAKTYVLIRVTDINDNAPEFLLPAISAASDAKGEVRSLKVPENVPLSDRITSIKTSDPDSGLNGQVELFIQQVSTRNVSKANTLGFNPGKAMFYFKEEGTGLYSRMNLDREQNEEIDIIVGAKDRGSPALTTFTVIRLVLEDENDFKPEWKYPKRGSDDLTRINSYHSTTMPITRVKAIDLDARGPNSQIVYQLKNSTGIFQLNETTGELRLQKSIVAYPIGSLFELSLQACDSGILPLCADSILKINITDAFPMVRTEPAMQSSMKNRYMLTLAGGVLIGLMMTICVIITLLVFMCRRRALKKNQTKLLNHQNGARFVPPPPSSQMCHYEPKGVFCWSENKQMAMNYVCGTPKVTSNQVDSLESTSSLGRMSVPQQESYIYIPFRTTTGQEFSLNEMTELSPIALDHEFYSGVTPILNSTSSFSESYPIQQFAKDTV
ncbi:hypothetical protein Ciccas_008417 [Cichlidogyrus casuarinus]|uniref:Cadherin domain-containing protein n=1 Tax=Cichlidogyrus casuarinus TaxID=1844966 RepID=A0ABD2Q0I6_9PLAT